LDVRLWFDEFILRNPAGDEIALADFIAGGKRWWDGLYAGDTRIDGSGIFPLGSKRKFNFGFYENPILNKPEDPVDHLIDELIASQAGRDWEDGLDESRTTGLRKSLMQEIVKQGAQSVEPLLNNLYNGDWAVRDDVAMMLGFIKESKAVKPLMVMMNTDESLSVRLGAAIALERIGTPESYQAAKEWYIANNISARRRVAFKLGHWLLFGETDSGLMERVTQVANSRNTTTGKVIQAWSIHQGVENPPATTPEWTFRLSPEECAYLEASVEL
jgi:hypothetical protein